MSSEVVLDALKGSSRLGGSICDRLWDSKVGAVQGLRPVERNAGCEVSSPPLNAVLAAAPNGSDDEGKRFSPEAASEAGLLVSC